MYSQNPGTNGIHHCSDQRALHWGAFFMGIPSHTSTARYSHRFWCVLWCRWYTLCVRSIKRNGGPTGKAHKRCGNDRNGRSWKKCGKIRKGSTEGKNLDRKKRMKKASQRVDQKIKSVTQDLNHLGAQDTTRLDGLSARPGLVTGGTQGASRAAQAGSFGNGDETQCRQHRRLAIESVDTSTVCGLRFLHAPSALTRYMLFWARHTLGWWDVALTHRCFASCLVADTINS